jgi:hypothetical protein
MALAKGEAETHPQEGADEDQVVEVGEDPDLARHPTDEGQLEREDPERGYADLHERGLSSRAVPDLTQAVSSVRSRSASSVICPADGPGRLRTRGGML